jgi:flagellar hook-basal body complex protein FliE
MPTPAVAANAYAALARMSEQTAGIPRIPGAADGGPNFGAVLKEAMHAVAEAGHRSDAQAQAVAAGKANMIDVVTAVAESESAIQALVSVRDKVIAAYEEVLKMPI